MSQVSTQESRGEQSRAEREAEEAVKNMRRLAVLVGCNYTNSRHELRGCINDVQTMIDVLVSRFGFKTEHIELLTDDPGAPIMPTGANIRGALGRMIDKAEAGDVLFFQYSGHGTRIPSSKGHGSKQDEAIVPCDFNLITDVDFRHLVNLLPEGASFTVVSDSCHSGGLIDQEKGQIGPNSTKDVTPHRHRQRSIPFNSILDHLTTLSGIDSPDVGSHLTEVFGSDASAKFHLRDVQLRALQMVKPDDGILLSRCRANEISADWDPTGIRPVMGPKHVGHSVMQSRLC